MFVFVLGCLYSVEWESSFYSGFLLIILQRVVCVCPCPPSHFLCPSPFPFGNHKVLCYVMLFLFGKEVHLYPFLESTSKKHHMILVFLCLTSLSMIISTSFLVAGHGMMSPFLRLSCNRSVCVYASCLPSHLCLPTQASSLYWLLFIVLP